jgi:hypothetical protein
MELYECSTRKEPLVCAVTFGWFLWWAELGAFFIVARLQNPQVLLW